MTTFVKAKDGTPLMPTTNVKKVRRLLRGGRAVIDRYEPFTIRLLYETAEGTQPIELTEDTGYATIGVSLKSERHEYVSEERTLLRDEKQRHDEQRREHRRPRRNRRRHRAPRFDNRRTPEGWLAPSLKNKADRHVGLYLMYRELCPITSVTLEMGSFDPQILAAVEENLPLPEGTGYQRGARYGFDTLRDAVFARDGHRCVFCGKGIADGAVLRVHHVGYWKNDHTDRMGNLATACTKCHVSSNHQKGGLLWGVEPKMGTLRSAAFMNVVRFYIHSRIKDAGAEVHMSYGTVTKYERKARRIEKSHANDAYCIGAFHPKHRCRTQLYEKRRRNNRVLEKFYDAKYVDTRNGKAKKAAELGCGRTSRSEPRRSDGNLRIFRGEKTASGRRSIRRQHYPMQPGDVVLVGKEKMIVKGVHCNGSRMIVNDGRSVAVKKTRICRHVGGWRKVS